MQQNLSTWRKMTIRELIPLPGGVFVGYNVAHHRSWWPRAACSQYRSRKVTRTMQSEPENDQQESDPPQGDLLQAGGERTRLAVEAARPNNALEREAEDRREAHQH